MLLLLTLLQLINMALSLDLVFTFFLSGVEVFAGFCAKVVLGSSLIFGYWSLLSAGVSRTEYGFEVEMLLENKQFE